MKMMQQLCSSRFQNVVIIILLMITGQTSWFTNLSSSKTGIMVEGYQHMSRKTSLSRSLFARTISKLDRPNNQQKRVIPIHCQQTRLYNAAIITTAGTTSQQPTIITASSIPTTAEDIQKIFHANDSNRLKKAKLRLAEVQGILPYGFSENISLDSLVNFQEVVVKLPSTVEQQLKPAVRARDITWKIAEPEIKYDPIATSQSLSSWKWLYQSGKMFLPIGLFIMKILGDMILKQEETNRSKRAKQLLQFLTKQSPALIKAGQSLSSRSDLLAKEYLASMETLQDRMPSFPNEKAFAVFEEETGMKFHDVYELVSPDPVAAASIGQVYKGRLKATGEMVAIKIQRPDCEQQIAVDLSIMRWYGRRVQDLIGMTKKNVDLVTIIDDFGDLLYREIDYRAEALNAQRFAELYSHLDDVYVPKIYTNWSSKRVLTMEWVDGVRLTDEEALKKMGLDGSKLVKTLVQSTLRQMLEHGFFHADPHAGNLLAMPNGKLCYLDFGMVSFVEANQRYSIIEAVIHMVNRDFVALGHLYQRMGFVPDDIDLQPIIEAFENALPDVLKTPVSEFNFKNVIGKLGDIMYKFPFTLPPYYISIMKCLGVLEGLAMQVDKDFRIVRDAYPYIASRLLTDSSEELQAALLHLLFKEGNFKLERFEDLLENAAGITDYDFTQAIDQLLTYLAQPKGKDMREAIATQVIEGFDALETEIVDLLLTYFTDPELTLTTTTSLVSSMLQTSASTSSVQRLDHFLDQVLQIIGNTKISSSSSNTNAAAAATSTTAGPIKSTVMLKTVIKVLRIVTKSMLGTNASNGLMSAKNTLGILRKIIREPVFRELVSRVVTKIAERTSVKMVRRVLGQPMAALANDPSLPALLKT